MNIDLSNMTMGITAGGRGLIELGQSLATPSAIPDPRAAFFEALRGQTGDPEQEARTAAERFVANVFIEPVLKQMRESNNAAPPFGPTQADKQFGALLDRRVAEQVVRAGRFGIVDRITNDLMRHQPEEWTA